MEPSLISGVALSGGMGLSILLTRRLPAWGRGRNALPLSDLSYCTLVRADGWMTPRDRGGADASAMALARSFMLGGVLVVAYVASVVASALLLLALGR